MYHLLSSKRVRRHVSLAKRSPLFDAVSYRERYGLSWFSDPATHFCARGWRIGYSPSRFFDTAFYLDQYPDVRTSGVNPLIHFLTGGHLEGRKPVAGFDPVAFRAAHPDVDFETMNFAEFCIRRYGSYHWQNGHREIASLPPDVVKAFRRRFDAGFYTSMYDGPHFSSADPFTHFIEQGRFDDMDPAPDFDIFYYRERMGEASHGSSPVLDWVRRGKELGLATQDPNSICIDPTLQTGAASGVPLPTLCVHAHCFYPELLAELIPGFRNLPSGAHVVVTVASDADREFAAKLLARTLPERSRDVRTVPNRGRDLGPFIVGCRDVWERYDIVLHLHTKSSPHVSWGSEWRRYLFDQTLGSPELIRAVLSRFSADASLGCLYPRNFHHIRRYTRQDENRATTEAVMGRLGYGIPALGRDYPAGSMAWYRTRALATLATRLPNLDSFDQESGQLDATLAHALERALPSAVEAESCIVKSYVTPRRVRLRPEAGVPARESSEAAVSRVWARDTPRISRQPPLPVRPLSSVFDPRGLNIHWIIPSFARGAGGHMTIFRIVELLETFGHYQTIWIQNAFQFGSQQEANDRISEWYRPVGRRVHVRFLPDDMRELAGDVVIATDCWTAFPAALAQNFKERFYLVQDYEPAFHPAGELQLTAESTYDFGIPALCAGGWLLELMRARGIWARSWDLCADHEFYFPGPDSTTSHIEAPRIAFYARPYTPRRAVTLGFAAFEVLHKRGFKFHVDLFGEEGIDVEFDFPHTQHGILSPRELGELYRACQIGVVFSTTNYSLVPLEMMACGLPVIESDGPSTRSIFQDGEVTFAKPTPYGVADAIETLLGDRAMQAGQREAGRRFVEATSWERSARAIESAVTERLGEAGYRPVAPAELAAPAIEHPAKVTVFIPTYNAGSGFREVLEAVTRQNCDFDYDVLIIDSGSVDGTVDTARAFEARGVRSETIPKAEFQHGRTRNSGIERSEADYVAIITQDARPKNERWLQALIGGFGRGPKVAGVIGRHEAYPEHDPFIRRDLQEMFNSFALLPDVIDRDRGLPSHLYPGGRSWRMLMHFYSDNNSAVARWAWRVLPYPEIDWGEDQVWADQALRLGLQKAYVDDAVVYHSHALSPEQQYQVSFTEGRFWAERFGLDLHPDPEAALAASNDRDQAFALQEGLAHEALDGRKLLNRAVVSGRYAGWRAARPPYLSSCDQGPPRGRQSGD
jgi:glycosyltransferase involved in cell wall biosynthesis